MPEKYYFDACIWRDYFENRSDRFKPLGDWALMLINLIIKNKDIVLYSDVIIEELKIKYSEEEINEIFEVIQKVGLLSKVSISELQAKEAALLCKQKDVAFGDALHTILARDNQAILVTRDKHFFELAAITKIRRPEELI